MSRQRRKFVSPSIAYSEKMAKFKASEVNSKRIMSEQTDLNNGLHLVSNSFYKNLLNNKLFKVDSDKDGLNVSIQEFVLPI